MVGILKHAGIEKAAFYDACDRHGIMVYQETMHSQAMPTADPNFAVSVPVLFC